MSESVARAIDRLNEGKRVLFSDAMRILEGWCEDSEIPKAALDSLRHEISRLRQLNEKLRHPEEEPIAYVGSILSGGGWDFVSKRFWAASGHHTRPYTARRAIQDIMGRNWRPPRGAEMVRMWGRPDGPDEEGRPTITELREVKAEGFVPITVFIERGDE